MKGRKDPSLSPLCSLLSIPHFLSFSYGYGLVTLTQVCILMPLFIAADDTEYGYHSASSSSAEHHAQLGQQQPQPQPQQPPQHSPAAPSPQQNYFLQGQNQSQVSETWRVRAFKHNYFS